MSRIDANTPFTMPLVARLFTALRRHGSLTGMAYFQENAGYAISIPARLQSQ